jgi:hypothetical protein
MKPGAGLLFRACYRDASGESVERGQPVLDGELDEGWDVAELERSTRLKPNAVLSPGWRLEAVLVLDPQRVRVRLIAAVHNPSSGRGLVVIDVRVARFHVRVAEVEGAVAQHLVFRAGRQPEAVAVRHSYSS